MRSIVYAKSEDYQGAVTWNANTKRSNTVMKAVYIGNRKGVKFKDQGLGGCPGPDDPVSVDPSPSIVFLQ